MKKKFGYGILCVIAFSVSICVGCSREADSGETMTSDPGGQKREEASLGESEELEEFGLQFDPDTKTMLTWMAPYGVAKSDDDVYIAFNNLLDQKGFDFYVNFYTPGNDSEEYIQLIRKDAASSQEIDIFSTGFDYYGSLYGDLVHEGLCQELNAYLENDKGKALYDTKDELKWKCLSVEGKIYGTDGRAVVTIQNDASYYYVNKALAEKYGIDCERMFEDTTYFFESIFAVEEGEKTNEEFEPYIRKDLELFDYPEDMTPFWGPIALCADSEGKYQAVNKYEDERIRQSIIACCELRKRGYSVQKNSETPIEADNCFVIVSGAPEEYDNAVEFMKPPIATNKSGLITCIAAWSGNQDAAFELLCAVHTDRELSEMLAFGIEGIHYHVEDDKIIKSDVDYEARWAATYLTNLQLLRDSDYDYFSYPAPLSEEEKAVLRMDPLLGNPLDCRGIKSQLSELSNCANRCFPYDLNSSPLLGQNFDEKYNEGLQNLKDAGIDEVLNEINQQLKDRGLQ